MFCVVRILLMMCTSWLLAGAVAVPRWSRARRSGRRDELLRRLLTGTVVRVGPTAVHPRPGPTDRLRLGGVEVEAVG